MSHRAEKEEIISEAAAFQAAEAAASTLQRVGRAGLRRQNVETEVSERDTLYAAAELSRIGRGKRSRCALAHIWFVATLVYAEADGRFRLTEDEVGDQMQLRLSAEASWSGIVRAASRASSPVCTPRENSMCSNDDALEETEEDATVTSLPAPCMEAAPENLARIAKVFDVRVVPQYRVAPRFGFSKCPWRVVSSNAQRSAGRPFSMSPLKSNVGTLGSASGERDPSAVSHNVNDSLYIAETGCRVVPPICIYFVNADEEPTPVLLRLNEPPPHDSQRQNSATGPEPSAPQRKVPAAGVGTVLVSIHTDASDDGDVLHCDVSRGAEPGGPQAQTNERRSSRETSPNAYSGVPGNTCENTAARCDQHVYYYLSPQLPRGLSGFHVVTFSLTWWAAVPCGTEEGLETRLEMRVLRFSLPIEITDQRPVPLSSNIWQLSRRLQVLHGALRDARDPRAHASYAAAMVTVMALMRRDPTFALFVGHCETHLAHCGWALRLFRTRGIADRCPGPVRLPALPTELHPRPMCGPAAGQLPTRPLSKLSPQDFLPPCCSVSAPPLAVPKLRLRPADGPGDLVRPPRPWVPAGRAKPTKLQELLAKATPLAPLVPPPPVARLPPLNSTGALVTSQWESR
eukprot:gene9041-13996_t